MVELPSLLDKLLRAGAPSGHEGPAASIWRDEASFATLSADGLGSSIARLGKEALSEAKGGLNNGELKCTGCPSGCGIFPDEQLDNS